MDECKPLGGGRHGHGQAAGGEVEDAEAGAEAEEAEEAGESEAAEQDAGWPWVAEASAAGGQWAGAYTRAESAQLEVFRPPCNPT